MTADELLQETYDQFLATGEWPLARELQIQHLDSNVRQIAKKVGWDRVACNEGAEGRCLIQLREIPNRAKSEEDLHNFVAAIRIIARLFIERGTAPTTVREIADELKLAQLPARRLAGMLYLAPGIWSAAGGPATLEFYLQPTERVIWFKSVASIEEYFAIHARVDREEAEGREADMKSFGGIVRPNLEKQTGEAPKEHGRRSRARRATVRRIFLSHASDDHTTADYLRGRLIDAVPDSHVFLASRPGDIPVGADWLTTIKKELAASDAYMVLLTRASVQRPWVQFETGAAWMSDRTLVTVVAGPLEKQDVPMPLSSFQLYSLSVAEEARHVFDALGGHLSDPDGFSARIRELMRTAAESSEGASGWMGVNFGGRFFAWAGPTIHELQDRPGVPDPPGLTEALKAAQMVPSFGTRAKLNHHLADGRLPVYETDRKKWRREVLYSADGDQILLVHPDASNPAKVI